MEALKKKRNILRTSFSQAYLAFLVQLTHVNSLDAILMALQNLEIKMAELDAVHTAYNQELFASNMSIENITKEIASNGTFRVQCLEAQLRVSKLFNKPLYPYATAYSEDLKRNLVLKNVEFQPKFSGKIEDWMSFWSEFKKINDETTMCNGEKLQCLRRALDYSSITSRIINRLPFTDENYDKIIEYLQNRFGRHDLLVEFYVRELLKLVIQNASGSYAQPVPLSNHCDNITSIIRSLETLEVTTGKCSTILYPLVELSLPQDVQREWQSSIQRDAADITEYTETKNRLERLLEFLQMKVVNEKRLTMETAPKYEPIILEKQSAICCKLCSEDHTNEN